MNCNQRVLAVMHGGKPDRIPFLGRMDFWFAGLTYQRKMPSGFSGCSLPDIHKSIGYGLEDWMSPCAFKYRDLEMITYLDGEKIYHEYEPEISFFPDLWGYIPVDREGEAFTELVTPIGKLVCQHRVIKESLISGITRP